MSGHHDVRARGNPDHDDSIRIIHHALDSGINFVDTADVYSAGESETIVGKALAGGRRDNVVLATKFHGSLGADPNQQETPAVGSSGRWRTACAGLGTDWIDLYQVHRPEPGTDFDETLGALSDLVHQGKIRYIGTSTFEPSAIVEGQWIAERRAVNASSPSSRRTRSSPAASSARYCPRPGGTDSRSSPGARW